MRIVVVGAGAVGTYFGGRLAQAGLDVTFVARGKTLEAIQRHGLRGESIAGDAELPEVNVANSPEAVGPADVVLVAVKAGQVRELAASLKPLVGPDTVVVPMQNGVEAPGFLVEALGSGPVVGGLCKVFAFKTDLCSVKHVGLSPAIELGEVDGSKSERVERIQAEFAKAEGMSTVVPDNIQAAMWLKLLYVEPLGAVGAISRQPIGVVRSVPATRQMLADTAQEVVDVALKLGIKLPNNAAESMMTRVEKLGPQTTASMHRDLVEGRPSELESQTGVIVRYGLEAGVKTPVHSAIYAALLPGELQARGEIPK